VSLLELDKTDDASDTDDKKWPTGFITQYTQLTLRGFKTSKTQIFNKFKLIETVALMIIVSLIWFQLPRTEETLRDRLGLVRQVVSNKPKEQSFLFLLFFFSSFFF
jgi:hypothetical protein